MTGTDLQERVDSLEQRVATLERRLENSGPAATGDALDRYDATVLDTLQEGETYGLEFLRAAYMEAGIRQKATLKERIRHLTTTYFEQTGTQQWRFTGGEGE